jgi:hypothetical protein
MNEQKLDLALEIISKGLESQIIFRKTKPDGQAQSERLPTIHIISCTARVINELIEAGYSLHVNNGLLSVNHYK